MRTHSLNIMAKRNWQLSNMFENHPAFKTPCFLCFSAASPSQFTLFLNPTCIRQPVSMSYTFACVPMAAAKSFTPPLAAPVTSLANALLKLGTRQRINRARFTARWEGGEKSSFRKAFKYSQGINLQHRYAVSEVKTSRRRRETVGVQSHRQ